MKVMLVTGGAGFTGSHFTTYFLRRNKNYIVINVDKMANGPCLKNLKEIESSPRHHFIRGDICNAEMMDYVMRKYRPDFIVNFAAEASPARSVAHPAACISNNIMGTCTLLEAARALWSRQGMKGRRFIQVSTGDVYGNLRSEASLQEDCCLSPTNPASASLASSELLCGAYRYSYGLPVIPVRCCSSYGPGQSVDGFVPSIIQTLMNGKNIYLPGSGNREREWLYVTDLAIGLIRALFYGRPGETYNLGSGIMVSDLALVRKIANLLELSPDRIQSGGDAAKLLQQPGPGTLLHTGKARNHLAWNSRYTLGEGLAETVDWYKNQSTQKQTNPSEKGTLNGKSI